MIERIWEQLDRLDETAMIVLTPIAIGLIALFAAKVFFGR